MSYSNSFPYTKIHMIGSGGTAVVYLAQDHVNDTQVAIKLISEKVSAEPKFRARFEREIEMLKEVAHPNILPVLDHGETGGQLYIVMPYINGGSVRDLLEEGAVSWEQTLEILEQVCPALDKMHEMGFIHRDIKPHNILIDDDGNVMLSDFGISRPIEATQDNSVTHTLDIVGTPEFIAPEQAADGELSAQTDIYQLGVTTFYMLTGQRLFNGSALQVIAKHIGEKPGSAGELIDGLPRNIDAVLHMALAKDPRNRFRTASDFLGALQLLGDQNTVTFQRLPGLPVRAAPPVAASPAGYQPVVPADVPAAAPSGFATGIVTPSAVSASSTTTRKTRPFMRYALVGLTIIALVVGGIFFIPGGPGGNGGRNGGGNGGGDRGGNGGGQGNGANNDNAPTLVEEIQDDTIIVLDNIDNEIAESDVEIVLEPAPTTDVVIDNTEETLVVQVVEAVTDIQLSAPEPTSVNNNVANDTPDSVNDPADDIDEPNPQPIAADTGNDGNGINDNSNGQSDNPNGGNGDRNGRGDRNNDGGQNGNPDGRGNDGNGQGRGGNGNGRGNGGNGNRDDRGGGN